MNDPSTSCVFFKKRSRQNTRQKKESSSSEEESEVKRNRKRRNYGSLYQQSANFSRKSRGFSDDEKNEDQTVTVAYKASHSSESRLNRDQIATATLEIDTDHCCDAQAIFERAQKLNKIRDNNNVYTGKNNYTQYIERKDTVLGNASSGFNRKGPMRAPTNLRATVRWDYQPDICKDYKETGYCSFGDSCKFLHDRSDYKHGWQIDQELAEGTYGIDGTDNRYEIIHHSSEEEFGEDIPLECLMCRKEYKDPVVTSCRHYFCSGCALKWYKKTARCYVCTADTKGFFKFAEDLLSRIATLRVKRSKKCNLSSEEEIDKIQDHKAVVDVANVLAPDQLSEPDAFSEHTAGDQRTSSDAGRSSSSTKLILPVPAGPKWAQPEAVEYCDSDEESD